MKSKSQKSKKTRHQSFLDLAVEIQDKINEVRSEMNGDLDQDQSSPFNPMITDEDAVSIIQSLARERRNKIKDACKNGDR